MTRKDYVMIAKTIKGHIDGKDDHVMRGFALSMVIELQKDNPRFDRGRFLEACGVQNWKAGILRDTALVGSTHQSWIASKSYEQ